MNLAEVVASIDELVVAGATRDPARIRAAFARVVPEYHSS